MLIAKETINNLTFHMKHLLISDHLEFGMIECELNEIKLLDERNKTPQQSYRGL